MPKQSQILYIEKEIGIPNPEIKLLKRMKFTAHRATTITEAKVVLREGDIDVLLIDVSMTSDPEWGNRCIEFIQNPDYNDIAKVVIDIEQDALGIRYRTLKDNPSVIHFHYKIDPNRYDKLIITLQECLL